jgi:hypothetical protein
MEATTDGVTKTEQMALMIIFLDFLSVVVGTIVHV